MNFTDHKARGLKEAILSLSFVTIMASAAISPALGGIAQFYKEAPAILMQLVLTLPAIFIITTSLFYSKISRHMGTKSIAVLGLTFYVLGGTLGGVTSNVYVLLAFRALLGVGVGLVMPLSTGLLHHYFAPDQQSKLMGYSAAINNLGGIVAISLSGYLVSVDWRYSFLVYLFGLVNMILVLLFLPNEKIASKETVYSWAESKGNLFYYISIFLVMVILYIFVANFAMINSVKHFFPLHYTGVIMSLQTAVGFFCGISFAYIIRIFEKRTLYVSACAFIATFSCLLWWQSIVGICVALSLLGLGTGTAIPYLNKTVLENCIRGKATVTMAFMSASLYLGQFVSTTLTEGLHQFILKDDIYFPYYFALLLSVILLGHFAYHIHRSND